MSSPVPFLNPAAAAQRLGVSAKALRLYEQVGDVLGQANCVQRLGDIDRVRSDQANARRRYESALRIYVRVGDMLGLAYCIMVDPSPIYITHMGQGKAKEFIENEVAQVFVKSEIAARNFLNSFQNGVLRLVAVFYRVSSFFHFCHQIFQMQGNSGPIKCGQPLGFVFAFQFEQRAGVLIISYI